VSYLLGGYIIRRWVHEVGVESMLMLGLSFSLVGGLLLFVLTHIIEMNGITIVLCSAVYVLGARLVIPNASALAMASQSSSPKGSVSALMGAIQMFGAVLLGGFIAQFSTRTVFPLALFFIGSSGATLALCGFKAFIARRKFYSKISL